MNRNVAPLLASLALVTACASSSAPVVAPPIRPDVAVAVAPYESAEVAFKEVLDERWCFLEHRGPTEGLGEAVAELLAEAERQDLEPLGPLIASYPEEGAPGGVRVGFAIDLEAAVAPPLSSGTTGTRMVAYAIVDGPFGAGARVLPAIDRYLQSHGWASAGARRELYGQDEGPQGPRMLTEVQVPWVRAR